MAGRPKLRRARLIFQRRFVGKQDQYGTPSKEWQDLCSATSAEVIPMSGGEEVIAARMTGITNYKIKTRYQPALAGLLSTDRAIEIGGAARIFNLQSILLPTRRGWTDILAQTGKPT